MTTFRWFILRLFWTLLLAPVFTFLTLWIWNEVLFSETSLSGAFVFFVLLVLIFPLVDTVLTYFGRRRYEFLHDWGKSHIKSDQPEEVQSAFALILQLFASGLISKKHQGELQHSLLRSYFPYYAEHPENKQFRRHLLDALNQGIRTDEAYHILKAYVLNQEDITLETAELAEELLDRRPADQALANYFVQHFITARKKHYRAEYFYARHLANNGPLSGDILTLCLDDLLEQNRQDDFAAWSYVRAFENSLNSDDRLERQLVRLHDRYQAVQRADEVAAATARCVDQLAPAEVERWRAQEQRQQQRSWRNRLRTAAFELRQYGWDLMTIIRNRRLPITVALLVLAGVAVVFLLISRPPAEAPAEEVAQTEVEETGPRFSAQVGAVKSRTNAEQAVSELNARGLEAYLLSPQKPRGWYRIRFGKYASLELARAAADSLKNAGIIDEYFVANYEKEESVGEE